MINGPDLWAEKLCPISMESPVQNNCVGPKCMAFHSGDGSCGMAREQDALIGMFGHQHQMMKEQNGPIYLGPIEYQFRIIGKSNGCYIMQMYSYLTGEPTGIQTKPTEMLMDRCFQFYRTSEQWLAADEKNGRRFPTNDSAA